MTMGYVGDRLLSMTTILPLFVRQLTDLGLPGGVDPGDHCDLLLQLFVARLVSHFPRPPLGDVHRLLSSASFGLASADDALLWQNPAALLVCFS